MRGPIDFIIVGFEGNKFDGSILTALRDAVDNGTIGVLALSLITKAADGTVTVTGLADVDDKAIAEFTQQYHVDTSGMISQEDVDEAAELIEPNCSAGLLIIEQLWAKPLKKALLDANGVLLSEGRIHPDAAAELNDEPNQAEEV